MPWVWDVLLIGVLVIAGYFRFIGIRWDGNHHLHPDERFLTMVESSISPVKNLGEYFDTANSSLNPNNRGFNFYVYGTLPIFIVRYVAGWMGQTGYDQVNVVGRVLSGVFDLGTILILYLIGKRLYRNARVGLLAALFLALSVLPIQLSHYFAVDTYANFFVYAALYAAICITTDRQKLKENPIEKETKTNGKSWWLQNWREFIPYGLFGLLYGMALASKVSIFTLALALPLAALIYYLNLPEEKKPDSIPYILRNLVLAGIIAFFTFRFFQPYSFMGPGFFGLSINQNWINNLKELKNISSGNVDVPYALQWARRPITFAFTNMVKWGFGLPLGIAAWAGFAWMAWRSFKGDWKRHLLVFFWAALIFITQSLNPVRAMRYQLPAYPALALIAAWMILKLWETQPKKVRKITSVNINWNKVLSVFVLIVTVVGSALWAFAFTRIYTRPVTRVAASEWIYGHIPAAINLQVTPDSGMQFMQPVAYQNSAYISADNPYIYGYTPAQDEVVTSFTIEHVLAQQVMETPVSFIVYVREPQQNGDLYKGAEFYQSLFDTSSDSQGGRVDLAFSSGVFLEKGNYYQIVLEVAEPNTLLKIDGGVWLSVQSSTDSRNAYLTQPVTRLTENNPFQVSFLAQTNGSVSSVEFGHIVDILDLPVNKTITLSIIDPGNPDQPLGYGELTDKFLPEGDPRGETRWIILEKPAVLVEGRVYTILLGMKGSKGALGLYNDVLAMESSWDDAIPLGLSGYGPFGYETGLYGNNRNFEMYWNDNNDKLQRFYTTLDQSDVIVITSNRQWGTTVRVPERYPLTTEYYRELMGCPDGVNTLNCYANAQPGMYAGQLGFELTAVFESDPNIGNYKINDQLAEEAFTVYDHPKVLIFQKTEEYSQAKTRSILGSVDISKAVSLTPAQASKFTGNLYLTESEKQIQTDGGTWSELFPATSLLNTQPWLAVVAWYMLVSALGWLVYPLIRIVFKGLSDKGYPFARIAGLILLAYFTWLVSSIGGQFSHLTIILCIVGLLVVNGYLAYRQRNELKEEIRTRWGYFLKVEGIALLLFGIMLFIRWSNPDLWHPWRGGEKPMDLSYFTAVLKSTVFPPYDPWYAGGYINYYYFGFVIAAVPTKLLGIVPYVAYNLIIPTFFAMTGLSAFSVGWNLLHHHSDPANEKTETEIKTAEKRSFNAGIVSVFLTLLVGNLGTVRLIWQAFQKIAAPDGVIDKAKLIQHITWFFQGLATYSKGGLDLPVGFGDWFWVPSRALPGDTITEFPFFTFTYADLHAHMIALPITMLVIGLALAFIYSKWRTSNPSKFEKITDLAITFVFTALILGALKITNTWDWPTYTAITCIAIIYSIYRYAEIPRWFFSGYPDWIRKSLLIVLALGIILGISAVLYLPFSQHYAQSYGSIDKWTGDHSPLTSYLVHWGLPLFLIASWFMWETHEWLASTPASSLKKIQPYLVYLQILTVLFFAILILLTALGIKIGWLVGIFAVWDLILLLRPGISDQKKFVHFLIGTGLFLTLFVELFVLVGDVGRMNTVFKFYYQAWTLLNLSAAAALMWINPAVRTVWKERNSAIWQIVFAILLISVYLYPVTAAADKIRDRMSKLTPKTLNGIEFMKTSTYWDMDKQMDLSQDYRAIKWMQENVVGSPVLVEANTVEYKWGNRYTIYTGLPGVLGWNWHQRQQRGAIDYNGIADRLVEIPAFYYTEGINQALTFLRKYSVEYIIVGQLEEAYYPGNGLLKFEQYNGIYWKEVYHDLDTAIYQVNP
jgi:YYY domain-containing protein